MGDDPSLPHDPLGLDDIDRSIRINNLNEQLEDFGMGSSGVSDDCPPEVHEDFLGSVLAFESAPVGNLFDQLLSVGVELPSPDLLDDAALHAKLWEIFNTLASRNTFFYHTDHFSDRELYEHLWHDSLREENTIMPPGSGWRQHFDLLGGCSEEDLQIGLRYYDTEEERQRWAEEFPDTIIPPHEDPPYDRDRLLPKADDEWTESDEEGADNELGGE